VELQHILQVYRALRQPMPTTVKPGRPPREGRPESSKTAKAVLRLTVRRLAMRGLVKDEKDAIKRLDELARGLSIAESRILAQRIRQEPQILGDESRLKRVVEEIRAQNFMDRVVSLRADIIERIERLARRQGKRFDEVINELLERALSQVGE